MGPADDATTVDGFPEVGRMRVKRSDRHSAGLAACAAVVALLVALSGCARREVSPAASPPSTADTKPTAVASPSPRPSQTPAERDLAWYALPQADDLFRGAAIASATGGPAGAVVLGNDRSTGGLIAWTSADGDGWVRHWLPGSTFAGGTPDLLVGGDFGYLAVGWRVETATVSRALWSSQDGVAWMLAPVGGLPGGEIASLVSGPLGVAATFDFGRGGTAVATSRDGRAWNVAALPAGAVPRVDGIVPLPDGFLILGVVEGTDAAGDPITIDSAWRTSDGVTWTADERIAKQLKELPNGVNTWELSPWGTVGMGDGAAVHITASGIESWPAPPDRYGRLIGGSAGLLWVEGGDRSSGCSAGWLFIDDGWRPLEGTHADRNCLDRASPSVIGFAATASGVVIIGQLASAVDRVAWLVRAPGAAPSGVAAGGPVATPPADALPDAQAATIDRPATCPSLPTTFAAVAALAPRTAVGCFGDRAMSFRAWVVDPGEGYGGTCSPFTPAWIRECVLPDYLLAAGRPGNTEGKRQLHAMRAPNATGTTKGVGRWVQVRGHYDDPISTSCRGVGDVGWVGLEPELPRALAVLNCRLVFVVTDIRTVK
jgi:hypothetical protein